MDAMQESLDAVSPSSQVDPPEAEVASPSTPDFAAIQLEALQLSRELSASPASALASSSEKAMSVDAAAQDGAVGGARSDTVAGAGTPLDFSGVLDADEGRDTPDAKELAPGEHIM